MKRLLAGAQSRIVNVRPEEIRAMWLAFVFHFVVLAGYYVIRPIRDEIGADRGVENLPWMYTGTLVGMLIANALYSVIVARMSRRRFLPIAYRFAIFNLIVFFVIMRVLSPEQTRSVLAPVFFVWVSVFNLFATTMFWSFMADLFRPEQGKRLFGFIAVGGSLGGILGGAVTSALVGKLGTAAFLLISAAMFEIAAQCVRFFPSDFREHGNEAAAEKPIGGSFWEGAVHIARSPYLFGLILFIMLYTVTNTWAYFQQSDLAGAQLQNRAARTSFLANIDIAVNTITVVIQLFLTGRLLKWLGVAITLVLMPLLSGLGFLAIGFAPVLAVLATFQVMRRAAGFALLRPAREILFTVLRREDKYKAKSLIDTFGYRLGDQIGAWSYKGLHEVGLNISATSFLATPLIAFWCGLTIWLGRKQAVLARIQAENREQPMPR